MTETSSGSFCANDSVVQSLMVALPFGGVGKSVAFECTVARLNGITQPTSNV